jgi:hypothetical protein
VSGHSSQPAAAAGALRTLLGVIFDDIEHVVDGNVVYIDRDMLGRYREDADAYLAKLPGGESGELSAVAREVEALAANYPEGADKRDAYQTAALLIREHAGLAASQEEAALGDLLAAKRLETQPVWDAAGRPPEPRRWLYGLTADEWLHLASEGEDSEVGPCCGNLGALRDLLRELLGFQSADDIGFRWALGRHILHTVEADGDGHGLGSPAAFPLLHQVLAGIRGELAGLTGKEAR